jgi:hypothetical protein
MFCTTNIRPLITIAAVIACVVTCADCWSQHPKPPQGSEESREFWSIFGDALKNADNNQLNLLPLIEHPKIRTEVDLSDSEFEEINSLKKQHMSEIRQLRDDYVKNPDKQLCKRKLTELLNKQDADFTQRVVEHSNFERLIQIAIQVYGNRAATSKEIAQRTELPPDKVKEIRSLAHKIRREEFEGDTIRDLMRNGPQNEKKMRDTFKQIENKINEAIKTKLTTEQLDALNQLRGEPIEIPNDLFDRRGDGRNGRGRPEGEKHGEKHDPPKKDKDKCVQSMRLIAHQST